MSPLIHIPEGAPATVDILWRWLHITSGVLWIGLLYFFNLVGAPFLGELDPPTRMKVFSPLMQRALNWFRWSALITVVAGLALYGRIVATDAHNAGASQGALWMSWFLIWAGVWMLFYLALRTGKGAIVAVVLTVSGVCGSWAFLAWNSHGWESNRTLAAGLGGGMAWFMLLNVWGVIWRINKKLLRWAREGAMPAEAAALMRQSSLCAKANFWWSFFVIFWMGVSSHYPVFGK
jgi:uncharacterized membrane protein